MKRTVRLSPPEGLRCRPGDNTSPERPQPALPALDSSASGDIRRRRRTPPGVHPVNNWGHVDGIAEGIVVAVGAVEVTGRCAAESAASQGRQQPIRLRGRARPPIAASTNGMESLPGPSPVTASLVGRITPDGTVLRQVSLCSGRASLFISWMAYSCVAAPGGPVGPRAADRSPWSPLLVAARRIVYGSAPKTTPSSASHVAELRDEGATRLRSDRLVPRRFDLIGHVEDEATLDVCQVSAIIDNNDMSSPGRRFAGARVRCVDAVQSQSMVKPTIHQRWPQRRGPRTPPSSYRGPRPRARGWCCSRPSTSPSRSSFRLTDGMAQDAVDGVSSPNSSHRRSRRAGGQETTAP